MFLSHLVIYSEAKAEFDNKLPRRKQRGIENLINFYYAASGGEFNPE
jgi:hypothetical protein